MIYRHTYVDKIMRYTDAPFVKILTGIRRCGKSTILLMIMEKLRERGIPDSRIISFRFDSMAYYGLTAQEMYNKLKACISPDGKTYFFLIEVQNIDDWERFVNSLSSDFDVDIYVTGSNSRMMSSEISTYLTGRYISFKIYPLSFAEYLKFKQQYTQISDIHNELYDYIRLGGFPATHTHSYTQEEIYTVVKDIYNATVFTNIVKRN
jgi:hypothetical protein